MYAALPRIAGLYRSMSGASMKFASRSGNDAIDSIDRPAACKVMASKTLSAGESPNAARGALKTSIDFSYSPRFVSVDPYWT